MNVREEIKELPLSTLVEVNLKPGTCFIGGHNPTGLFISPQEYEQRRGEALFREPDSFQVFHNGTRVAGYYAGGLDRKNFMLDTLPDRASFGFNKRTSVALLQKASAYTVAFDAVSSFVAYTHPAPIQSPPANIAPAEEIAFGD